MRSVETTPKQITQQIHTLCRQVDSGSKPVYVPCRPVPHAQRNRCFSNVEAQVKAHEGAIRYGWTIWEWPGVGVEAEFHAVWVTPDGSLLDISPHDGEDSILFLPDTLGKVWTGEFVPNVRHLDSKKVATHFLGLAEDLAHGRIGRNATCPCGSGMKYKKCCLTALRLP